MGSRAEGPPRARGPGAWEVFRVFLRLGLTSFGGPIAHLGYFREELVLRRRWLDEPAYAGLVALCQFLPGPASSQVGMAIGLSRAGLRGALAAWCGFTLPSAVAMILIAITLPAWDPGTLDALVHGLKLVAVAVVAHAVWGMARAFCRDWAHAALALAAAACVLVRDQPWVQVAVIAAAGLVAQACFRRPAGGGGTALPPAPVSRAGAFAALALFFVLLGVLPLLAAWWPGAAIADTFYRTGALVFGGGHVVLPLLQSGTVGAGWIGQDTFLAGYGAAQAMPGPLFTFAAFLGAAMAEGPGGWAGGALCLAAIFLPSLLLVLGVLPFWNALQQRPRIQAALGGINAAVVGLLAAALYRPAWTGSVQGAMDVLWVASGIAMLAWFKWPAWLVVLVVGGAGFLSAR
ncbi:chromate efflux transporter [[Pseudomonas] boreopolis]|uniref:chromate efflux transporter n=1 Tax=Xanthomonas boreopolis TaxID=86183 RepID=UPI003D9B2BD8